MALITGTSNSTTFGQPTYDSTAGWERTPPRVLRGGRSLSYGVLIGFSGASAPLIAVAAIAEGDVLRILFGAPLDPSYVVDTGSFSVSIPNGDLAVDAVSLGDDGHSVELALADAPPLGNCTVAIAAGAARSTAGSLSAATTLEFSGTDRDPPEILNLVPAIGANVGPTEAISFDVTDSTAVRRVLIGVHFDAIGRSDLAYDGTDWRGGYTGTRTPIADGLRFTLQLQGGWPAAPTIQVHAIDVAGNEA